MSENIKIQAEPDDTFVAPADCGHKDWAPNCPRCFFEMNAIARQNITASSREDQMHGAILIIWHLMTVIADMENQLAPLTQSIDLQKNQVAKDLIRNLHQLSLYMMDLGADPEKMARGLAQGAALAKEVQDRIDSGETKAEPPRSNLIITG